MRSLLHFRFCGKETMDKTHSIRIWLTAGLIAKIAYTAILFGIWALQDQILRLAGSDAFSSADRVGFLPVLLMPVVSLAVYVILYFMMKSHLDRNAPQQNAGLILLAGVGTPIVLSALSLVFNLVQNLWIARTAGTIMYAKISTLGSYGSWFGVLSTFAMLAMAAAAGMIWQRSRDAEP